MEPVEPVLRNIYQSNTHRKDLNRSHFGNEPRTQEKQQMKDQQFQVVAGSISLDVKTVFHTWKYGGFI